MTLRQFYSSETKCEVQLQEHVDHFSCTASSFSTSLCFRGHVCISSHFTPSFYPTSVHLSAGVHLNKLETVQFSLEKLYPQSKSISSSSNHHHPTIITPSSGPFLHHSFILTTTIKSLQTEQTFKS